QCQTARCLSLLPVLLCSFHRALPYKSVTTGCRFDLRSVYVLYLQADITKFSKQTDNIGKKSLDMAFKSFAPEVVYRTVVRHAVTRKPHEMDVLLKGLLDTTARINVIQIGIEQHLDHHTRVETGRATTFVLLDKLPDIKLVNYFVHQTYRMVLGDP